MDRAAAMEILVAAVDRGGFTAAAEHLGVTPSAVSKAVTRLEQRLGVRLLERTTRRIVPTPAGQDYLAASRLILGAIDDADATAMEGSGRPQGRLRINSGISFAMRQLAPVLVNFSEAYPDVRLDLTVEDRICDVVGEELDLAIRTGPVGDERLAARRFAEVRRVIVASPAYLDRHGVPKRPADLARHACLAITTTPDMARWPFREEGQITHVAVQGPVRIGTAEGALALALADVGIARVGDMLAAPAIREGRLIRLLAETHVDDPIPMHLVFPPGRQRLPKVRAFLDFVSARFSDSPWRL